MGLNRHTGQIIRDWSHVVQSIGDILSTPRLTRVLRRAYGARVMDLVDAPANDPTLMVFQSSVATALLVWEPRFELTDVTFDAVGEDGRVQLKLDGIYYPRGHKGDRVPDAGVRRDLAFAQSGSGWRQVI